MDYAQEQAAIERRRRIAEMLMQQGQAPLETNQVAGGYVVPVSPLGAVAKIAQQLAGAYIGRKADERGVQLESDRLKGLSGIDFNAPDAANKLAQYDPELAVKLAMKRAQEHANNRVFQVKTVMKPDGKLGYVGFNTDGSVKDYDLEAGNDIQYVDTGGQIVPMFKKGAPGNIPQADGIQTQPQPAPNIVNTGQPYTKEELDAIYRDAGAQPPQSAAIPKTISPADQVRLKQADRAQQRADTQLGLSLEDQQMQRERLQMDKDYRGMRDVPAQAQQAFIANNEGMRKIDEAISAIQQNPNALGFKNVLPDALIQRVDPKGVDVRSRLGEIGSVKIHDISGAAVSAAEAARLKKFIPSPEDNPEVALDKLKNLRREYEANNRQISEMYTSGRGYRHGLDAPAVIDDKKAKLEQLRRELYGQ